MSRFSLSTLTLGAALAFAPSAFACGDGDHDKKDDKKEDSVVKPNSVLTSAPSSPSCGDDGDHDKKDDKKES
jgi:hypothetical protein